MNREIADKIPEDVKGHNIELEEEARKQRKASGGGDRE
jgi:hypothetical protein